MDNKLPTARDLEKLTLRAIAAFTSRMACRVSIELRHVIPDNVIDDVLDLTEATWRAPLLSDLDQAALWTALGELYGAHSAAHDTPEGGLATLVISQSIQVACLLIEANGDPLHIEKYVLRAAEKAAKAVSDIDLLYPGTYYAKTATIRDFNRLIDSCAANDETIVGDPVDCFDTE